MKVLANQNMNLRMKDVIHNSTLVALVLLGSITVGAEERTVERILKTANEVVKLSIVDGTGATSYISTGDSGRVVVKAKITGFLAHWGRQQVRRRIEEITLNPPIKQDGNRIWIGELPWRVRKDLSISYDIQVPPNTDVYSNGPETVHVQNLVGNLHVENADIFASEICGDVKLTDAQTVHVSDVSGNLHVTGGRITASDVKGNVSVKRAEYVAIEDVRGKLSVTDRSNVVNLDGVIVEMGTYGL